jgi:hypothetical protein
MWYEAYTEMKIYILFCWDITPCSMVRGYLCFETSFYLEDGMPWKHW